MIPKFLAWMHSVMNAEIVWGRQQTSERKLDAFNWKLNLTRVENNGKQFWYTLVPKNTTPDKL